MSVILVCYLLLLLLAAAYDFAALRIPNPLSAGIVGLVVIRGLTDPAHFPWLDHLAAGLAVLLVGIFLHRFGLLGGGDVKLLAATSFWVGLSGLPSHLLLVALVGGFLGLLLLALRPLLWPLVAHLPARWSRWVPHSMTPGAGVPYGVPIAASGMVLAVI